MAGVSENVLLGSQSAKDETSKSGVKDKIPFIVKPGSVLAKADGSNVQVINRKVDHVHKLER